MSLKRPAPLDVDLRAEAQGDEATLFLGEDELAVAERAELAMAVPEPPSLAEAKAAEQRFDKGAHIYPGCFVCGPGREPGDGWRIFPGSIAPGRVAASWTPGAEFADDSGAVRSEFLWAALDCPGYFAVQDAAGLALLGRIAVTIKRPVPSGEQLIVQGWAIASEGRKHRAGTAIHDAEGRPLASAEQVWISLR